MNWIKVLKFSSILLVSSILIGMAEGFAIGANENHLNISVYVSTVAYFAVDIIIFIFLAKGLNKKPFQHAIAVLILSIIANLMLLILVNGTFFISGFAANVALGVLALVVGTSIGLNIKPRGSGVENA